MVPSARMKIKLCVDPAALMCLVGGLHAQVLGVLSVFCDPAQQPVVALILTGDLQGDHTVPAKENHPHLGSFSGHCQSCTDPY